MRKKQVFSRRRLYKMRLRINEVNTTGLSVSYYALFELTDQTKCQLQSETFHDLYEHKEEEGA